MSSDPPSSEAPAADAPKGAGRGGSVVLIAAIAILFGVGLGVGWLLRPQPEKRVVAEKTHAPPPGPLVVHEGPHKEHLEIGDQRFREGAFDEALGAYREMIEENHGVLRGALQYRVAICQEALGNVDKAFAL